MNRKVEIEKWGDSHRLTVYGLKANEPFDLAFASDLHLDSKQHDSKSWGDFTNRVIDRDAPLILLGDTHDIMQGKGDNRAKHGDTKKSLLDGAYLYKTKEEASETLSPLASYIKMMIDGNHEASATDHYGVDMTQDLIDTMKYKFGGDMVKGYYGGYLFVRLMIDTRRSVTYLVNYHHGKSTATPDTLAKNNGLRIDSHLVIAGHTHRESKRYIDKERVTNNGYFQLWRQWHIEIAGFKHQGGWELKNRFDKRARGGCFVTLSHDGRSKLTYNEPEMITYL